MQNDNLVNSENNKSKKLFILAVIFALLAGVGTFMYLKIFEHRLEAKLTPPEKNMISVVVATQDLPVGAGINSKTMAVRKVPAEYVNSDVITAKTFGSVNGAVLVKPLAAGKMLSTDFLDLNIPKDFSGTIQMGHRAVTIEVDEINSISGMVRPGNYIDLYVRLSMSSLPQKMRKDQGETSSDMVVPLLEDVEVLATDHSAVRPNEDEFKNFDPQDKRRVYSTLTLEVTPKEAALLAIAANRGALIAALRNPKDTDGILFGGVTTNDLLHNAMEMLNAAKSKQHNRSLSGVHLNKDGQLVTRDGVVLKDKGLHLNKNGLLVTKNGTVLSGRNLTVGPDGTIRAKNGSVVDPDSLVAGKGGTLIDKNGTVIGGNGYKTLKGGFLEDKDGNILTPDGHILKGVTVAKDGTVRTKDGKVLKASDVVVADDGSVHLRSSLPLGAHLDTNGQLIDKDGNVIPASSLVTVGKDGKVRTKDGKVLDGVYVGKDGKLHNKDGSILTAAQVAASEGDLKPKLPPGTHLNDKGQLVDKDGNIIPASSLVTVGKDGKVRTKDGKVLDGVYVGKDGKLHNKDGSPLTAAQVAASKGIPLKDLKPKLPPGTHLNNKGQLVDKDGNVVPPSALVTVGKDGKVRAKDGTVLEGVYRDKDGVLRNKDGSPLTAAQVADMEATDVANKDSQGPLLAGVTAVEDPNFAKTVLGQNEIAPNEQLSSYEVEYIVGGASNGAANTFKVLVGDGTLSEGEK